MAGHRSRPVKRRAVIVDRLDSYLELLGPATNDNDGTKETTVIAAARKRSVGIQGMSEYRSGRATTPLQLVLGFGNLSECATEAGIARAGDLLGGQPAGS
jgi:GntR family transcriptional regulator / MocR family aminotransferase